MGLVLTTPSARTTYDIFAMPNLTTEINLVISVAGCLRRSGHGPLRGVARERRGLRASREVEKMAASSSPAV